MDWVYDGQLVDIPSGLRCIVKTAMGDTARVVNKLHGIDTWFDVSELRAVEQSERCRECLLAAARRERAHLKAKAALDALADYALPQEPRRPVPPGARLPVISSSRGPR